MSDDYFEIKDCELTFETVLKDENLSQERIAELRQFQMLFLPEKNFRKKEGYCFHSQTRDFYLYCKKESPNNYFDFCIEKNNYKELTLNSSELYIGTFLIKDIVLPIFINLISAYIHDKLTNKDDKVIINIITNNEKTNKNQEIAFRGTKKDFEEKFIKTLKTYSKEGKIIMQEQKGTKIDVLS
jgi:hypothetical protein